MCGTTIMAWSAVGTLTGALFSDSGVADGSVRGKHNDIDCRQPLRTADVGCVGADMAVAVATWI